MLFLIHFIIRGFENKLTYNIFFRLDYRELVISEFKFKMHKSTFTDCSENRSTKYFYLFLVMAGTGDLDVIRLVRFLRSRVGPNKHSTVTYGSHMALHMALGLLFLGGGRYTLNTQPESVAAMLAAFFPKFPTHSNDNR